jgi:hypothetical protein
MNMGPQSLNRITFGGNSGDTPAGCWSAGRRVRDLEVAPDDAEPASAAGRRVTGSDAASNGGV